MKVYAVKSGWKTGKFYSWDECREQVNGCSGAMYKSFNSEEEADKYLGISKPVDVNISVENNDNSIQIYVDGSYNEKANLYGWAYVVLQNDKIICQDSGMGSHPEAVTMRNVAGELAAAMRSVKHVKAINDNKMINVTMYHDYTGISDWIVGYWRAKNPMTQAYVKFMEPYKSYITFIHVDGHTGVKWNEYVDQEAKKAIGIKTK